MKGLCKACDRPLRKGSARRATVMSTDGMLESGLVCARCALRAIAFVVPPAVTVPPACASCKRGPAGICFTCWNRLADAKNELEKANVVLRQCKQISGREIHVLNMAKAWAKEVRESKRKCASDAEWRLFSSALSYVEEG